MKEITGKYGTAKIFTELVEDAAIVQVRTLMNQEFVEGCRVRMMPDIHSGAGCVIGTTMEIKDKICPNIVGVDIGCGMHVTKLDVGEIDFEKLDRIIRERIPSGFYTRRKAHEYIRNTRLDELWCRDRIDMDRARLSLGTLGGGNHFIEVDKDDDGYSYLVIHSGSRHLGVEVCKFYQDWANDAAKEFHRRERENLIDTLKSQGREKDIQKELAKLKYRNPEKDSKWLSWIGGLLFNEYIHDMKIVQEYAKWNRIAIVDIICEGMGWGWYRLYDFYTIHNYVDTEHMILRKGAVSAQNGEKLLIPMNMRDGSLICVGKGNPDWNYSAPHGAGRLMSRTEAKEEFSLNQYRRSMKGIYTTSVSFDTLDECPMAYKPMQSIVNNIGDTVDILRVIKPVYNFKAGN